MSAIKRILVAVDHSEPSARAAELAADIAQCHDAELVLFTAIEYPDSPVTELARIARERYPDQPVALVVEQAVREELGLLGERLTAATDTPVACVVEYGNPAETIVSRAGRDRIDLIAMGHRGYGGLARLVIGSVAKQVIDTATCPVVVVR
jgi:nucleotide-binding universal stress UspA family protein